MTLGNSLLLLFSVYLILNNNNPYIGTQFEFCIDVVERGTWVDKLHVYIV